MKRPLSLLAVTASVALLVASTSAPQSQDRAREIILRDGPYQVVTSKPLKARPWKATTAYERHDHLTELFNQLAIDGLEPVFVDVTTEHYDGDLLPQDRVLVVCRRK